MEPTLTDWISAISAALTTLLTLGLLIAAVVAGFAALRTLRQMQRDSEGQREDSARATRPYVHARMAPSLGGTDSWDMILENTGRTAAHDLRISIDAKDAPTDDVTGPVYRLASAGLTVHPGERLRTYWVMEASKPNRLGFPPAFVTVEYLDSEGQSYKEQPVRFDPDNMGLTPTPSVGSHTESGDRGKDLILALRGIARNIGELNR